MFVGEKFLNARPPTTISKTWIRGHLEHFAIQKSKYPRLSDYATKQEYLKFKFQGDNFLHVLEMPNTKKSYQKLSQTNRLCQDKSIKKLQIEGLSTFVQFICFVKGEYKI